MCCDVSVASTFTSLTDVAVAVAVAVAVTSGAADDGEDVFAD